MSPAGDRFELVVGQSAALLALRHDHAAIPGGAERMARVCLLLSVASCVAA